MTLLANENSAGGSNAEATGWYVQLSAAGVMVGVGFYDASSTRLALLRKVIDGPDRVSLERLVGDRGWQVDVAAGSVMGRWSEIVGREVAEHCEPVSFEAGVLSVRADSTAWATQIRLLSSSLLGSIAEAVGPDVVHELRVHGPSAPSWSRGPRRTSDGRGPRDTYG